MQEDKICPYPGLRPFNDDEAIFFKGRDKNISSIIELFETRKFMMLTGASGDGKSSLVYAGVVPNARAGLFKAKYNSWAIADFRPERTPLANLAKALNSFFKFDQEELEKKLSFGFSSLVSIYKNSSLFIDAETDQWKTANDQEKKQLKRKASNLLIIADQFEEFFTNTENYFNGIASVESQAVVNVLLETAKIALAEDLPIYIICTMRSDYIGQCAAFRGLPEYIGFSHFFVPRLKRNEISQVIEDPALFNGDKISRRLSERLLNDITDGHDQLPILQHALNQIWKIAAKNGQEMDFLHYAMVGGLKPDQLQNDDQVELEAWLNNVPEFKKGLFEQASLENILNAHADELLETAYTSYANNSGEKKIAVSKEDSRLIIKTTFQCLTKIDDGRAVRNRMTLQEISDIINRPDITTEEAGNVLNIFRQQGNTFIKPFITEDPSTLTTSGQTVLDITHESLIRNWDILKIWANEEYENLLTWQDFNKQLQRWVNNGKKKGYLLPIGPLTFFETWFNLTKPNKYWLVRYDKREMSNEEKLFEASETITDAKQFIRKSGKALFVSRTVIKYGANRLLAGFGILALILLCTYFYFDYKEKQNDYIISDISTKGINLLRSDKISKSVKANFLINLERLNPGQGMQVLDDLNNDTLAFNIAAKEFVLIENYDDPNVKNDPAAVNALAPKLLFYMDSLMSLSRKYDKSQSGASADLEKLNSFTRLCAFAKYHGNTSSFDTLIKKNVKYIVYDIDELLKNPTSINADQLKKSIELILTFSDNYEPVYDRILAKLSPFSDSSSIAFKSVFPKEKINEINSFVSFNKLESTSTANSSRLSHNGGYQILSYLYAARGDYDNLHKCLDSLFAYSPGYQYMLSFYLIAHYVIKYNDFPSIKSDGFFQKFIDQSGKDKYRFYGKLITCSNSYRFDKHLLNELSGNSLILYFLSDKKSDLVWDQLNAAIKSGNEDEKNLKIANALKHKGIYASLKNEDKKALNYFSQSFSIYTLVPEDFLEKIYDGGDVFSENSDISENRETYLNFSNIHGDYLSFFNFIVAENHQGIYFNEGRDLLIDFIYRRFYYSDLYRGNEGNLSRADVSLYYKCIKQMDYFSRRKPGNNNETSFIQLVLIDKLFNENDSAGAMALYRSLELKQLTDKQFQQQNFPRNIVNCLLLGNLAVNLAVNYHAKESGKIMNSLLFPSVKRNSLIDICYSLQEKGPVEDTFIYLDSLFSEIQLTPAFGTKLFNVLGLTGSQNVYDVAMDIYKDMSDDLKPAALINFVRGISSGGLYYKAGTYIPQYISRESELVLYNEILHAEVLERRATAKGSSHKLGSPASPAVVEPWWRFYDTAAYGRFNYGNYEPDKLPN